MTTRISRSIATGAAALMVAAGLSVSAGAAVANADTSKCGLAQTVTYNDVNTAFTDYSINKEVLGDGTAAPGGTVKFRTTVTGSSALINRIEDYHPEGFQLIEARSNVHYVVGGQRWEDVTNDVKKNSSNNSVYLTSNGWTTAFGAQATLETTYRVPTDATPGDKLNTGAGMSIVGFVNGDRIANPIDTCVTIREPNAVEVVGGSLEGLGLGSSISGSSAITDSATSPAGFIADVVNGVDFGKIIGAAAGS